MSGLIEVPRISEDKAKIGETAISNEESASFAPFSCGQRRGSAHPGPIQQLLPYALPGTPAADPICIITADISPPRFNRGLLGHQGF